MEDRLIGLEQITQEEWDAVRAADVEMVNRLLHARIERLRAPYQGTNIRQEFINAVDTWNARMQQINESVTPDALQAYVIGQLNSGVPIPESVAALAGWYASSLQTVTNELVAALDSLNASNRPRELAFMVASLIAGFTLYAYERLFGELGSEAAVLKQFITHYWLG
ncbi:hypothetical protein [Streptomyces sp. NPDC059918]|uniref:hypothetical protein n=1 Tax=unclassified Streptomyces TaxID=2593676 RepID=UPI003656C0D2